MDHARCIAIALLCLARPGCTDTVLLDETWSPEIMVNDVAATETDTVQTGDPSMARSGEFSVKLENRTGSPHVRFRSATAVKLDELPPELSVGSLWYRTDRWTGRWQLQVWVWVEGYAPAPVKVLQADLDAGGDGLALVADDEWHQAKAPLKAVDDYAKVPHDLRLPAYVWLAPTSGWDVPHCTYVDRIEVTVGGDDPTVPRPAPEPATHVRPRPGAQTSGPGWVWWEAEDAVQSNVPYGGALAPDTLAEQAILSNGAWLQWHGVPDPALDARWTVDLPEAGRYTLWCRAMGETFRWRWSDGKWRPSTDGWTDECEIRGMGKYVLSVQWLCLGAVDLPAGKDTFAVTMEPDGGAVGFDCFLLTKGAFKPDGPRKP